MAQFVNTKTQKVAVSDSRDFGLWMRIGWTQRIQISGSDW